MRKPQLVDIYSFVYGEYDFAIYPHVNVGIELDILDRLIRNLTWNIIHENGHVEFDIATHEPII